MKMGVPEARLTKSQTEMWITRTAAVSACVCMYVCIHKGVTGGEID